MKIEVKHIWAAVCYHVIERIKIYAQVGDIFKTINLEIDFVFGVNSCLNMALK